MTAMVNAAADVATKVASLGTINGVALVLEGAGGVENVFVGEVREPRTEVPSQAVFVKNLRGNAKPDPYLGIDSDFYRFQVDVTVRSNPAEYGIAEQLTRDLMLQLHRHAPTGYVTMLLQQPGPDPRGETNEREFLFGFVLEVWWRKP